MEGARLAVQYLQDVLADLAQAATTGFEVAPAVRHMHHGAPRQMSWHIAHAGALSCLTLLASLLYGRNVGVRLLAICALGRHRRHDCLLRKSRR